MHALARKRVQVRGQGSHQGFAFTGFHFGDASLVQHDTAQNLHMVGPLAQHPGIRLPDGGKGLRKQIIEGFAFFQPRLKLSGFAPQLLIAQAAIGLVQGLHLLGNFFQLLDGGV